MQYTYTDKYKELIFLGMWLVIPLEFIPNKEKKEKHLIFFINGMGFHSTGKTISYLEDKYL
jgi:hypothetical protein